MAFDNPPVWVVVEATVAEPLVAVAEVLFDVVLALDVVVAVFDAEEESTAVVLLPPVVVAAGVADHPLAGVYASVSTFPLSPLSPS